MKKQAALNPLIWQFDWRTLMSAVLIVLAFPPYDLSFLVWICLIPWFFALQRRADSVTPLKDSIVQGIWLSVWMSLLGFFWVGYVLKQFGNLPWPVAVVGLLLYSFIGQPQFYLFARIQQLAGKRLNSRVLAPRFSPARVLLLCVSVALTYAGLDWLIPKLFVDTMGHALYSAEYLRQIADLGGVPLLTFLVYLVNLSIWLGLMHFRNISLPMKRLIPLGAVAAALLVASFVYGMVRFNQVQTALESPLGHANMAVIQANIGDFDKVAAETGLRSASRRILSTYYAMSQEALRLDPAPQVIVWPETSYPSTFRTPMTSDEFTRDKQLERFVSESGVPLLFGGYDHSEGLDYNAFFLLEPDPSDAVHSEGKLQIYRKNILLLFGEYIPGASQIPMLKRLFPQVGNFGRGPGPQVYPVRLPFEKRSQSRTSTQSDTPLTEINLAPVICYEVLFPSYVIEAARKGSQAIVNITNDSWFGPWGEPQLHLALSTFRTVETRLPQLRGTNTGISALVLPTGEITHPTDLFKPEILNVQVPVIQPIPTLMLLWGDWFAPVAFLLGGVGLVVFLRQMPKT